jgi:hypothetical protein
MPETGITGFKFGSHNVTKLKKLSRIASSSAFVTVDRALDPLKMLTN